MGEIESAHVDVGAVLGVAGRCDAVADVVDGVARGRLGRLAFDGALAGRDHVARGDAVRRAVADGGDQTPDWGRAMRDIAAALRASADRYVDGDARGAARLG